MVKWVIPTTYWEIINQYYVDARHRFIEVHKHTVSPDLIEVKNTLDGIIPIDSVDVSEIRRFQEAVDQTLFHQSMTPTRFCDEIMEPWDFKTPIVNDWTAKRLYIDKKVLTFLTNELKYKIKLHRNFFKEEQDPDINEIIIFDTFMSVEVEVDADDLMIWKLSQG